MGTGKLGRRLITRTGMLADLRILADLAEQGGDRVVAVRAMKIAWRIEHCCPAVPVPPSTDQLIDILEATMSLARRFAPESAIRFKAMAADLRLCRLELLIAERENATLH